LTGDAESDAGVAVGIGWRVTSADRAALLRKYQLLAAWRRSKDASADEVQEEVQDSVAPPDRAALRALSIEFPGALRELDVLGLPEMLRRIDRLARPAARQDDEGEVWIPWILGYHALMRAALVAKRAGGRAHHLRPVELPQVVRTASAAAGIPIDEPFLRSAARPPGGRLAIVVFAALARRFNVPALRISTALFPIRRPSPYHL
jgi:hypothetical protein